MVQYRDANERTPDNYWKAVDYATPLPHNESPWSNEQLKSLLRANGVEPKSRSKPRLFELLNRSERGLFWYESCSKVELQLFCKQRGITNGLNKTTMDTLVQHLEHADDNRTFDKFRDLPAELRLHVYDFYFDWLADRGVLFRRIDNSFTRIQQRRTLPFLELPPITKIKLFQHETLPLFYQHFEIWRSIFCPNENSAPVVRARFLLEDVSDDLFNHFRVFQLIIRRPEHPKQRIDLRIMQSSDKQPAECRVEDYVESAAWRAREKVEAEIQEVLEMVAARPESKKLLRSDLVTILRRLRTS